MRKAKFILDINMDEENRDKVMGDCFPVTMFFLDEGDANRVFRHFLNNHFRPIRLTDGNGRLVKEAERGIRTSC